MSQTFVISLADSEVARIEPLGAALQVVFSAITAQAHEWAQAPVAGSLLGLTLVVEQAHAQGMAVLGDGLGRLRSGVLHTGSERLTGWALPWAGVAEGTLALEFANGSQIRITGNDWRLIGAEPLRFCASYAC